MSNRKKAIIEYLYLDLKQCDRCKGTNTVLDEVVETLTPALQLAGYEIDREKTEMANPELATEYRFLSSPTIRVNGKDICLSVEENDCGCCSDIAGTNIDCRVFRYNGETYEVPPKEMLANGILHSLFSSNPADDSDSEYIMPENLIKFYENINIKGDISMKTMQIYEPAMCCPTGLCGINSNNPDLMRMAVVIDNLKKNGVTIQRYNLTGAPQEFIKNTDVNKLINDKGTDVLPIIMFDGKTEITGRYPTNAEIVMHLNVSPEFLEAPKQEKKSGCCCSGNNDDGCC